MARLLLDDARRWRADLSLLREGLQQLLRRKGTLELAPALREGLRLARSLEIVADRVERLCRLGEPELRRLPTKEECFADFWSFLAPELKRIIEEYDIDDEGQPRAKPIRQDDH